MRKTRQKEKSAGFIVVRESSRGWQVLGLKVWGKLDIPKGHLEEGESNLEAAIRECNEEAGILIDTNASMPWGNLSYLSERPHKDVVIFLAKTDQDPEIRPNPETNKFEHDGFMWCSWDRMKEMSYPYLRNAFDWAESIVEGHS